MVDSRGTRGGQIKTQQEINDEARGNFEKEMRKHKDFFGTAYMH